MAQELYELPEGWKWRKLGEVFDVRDGTHDSPKYIETGYPLVTSKNITGKGLDLKNVKYISQADYDDINRRSKVDIGDILFAMIGTIGFPTVITELPNYAIKNVALFKKRYEEQNSVFFKYLLESPYVIEAMLAQAKGAAQKFVGLKVLRGFNIPVPSEKEQQRLVKKLDTLLNRIDTAVEHLKRSLELNDQLFASSLNRAFNPLDAEIQADGTYQLPEGWEWKTLNDIFEIARGGSPRPIKSFITDNEDGINWIKIGDVATGEKYISQTAEKIKPEGVSKSRKVYPGDFILSNSMSFGRPYIMQIEGCIHDGWLLLRPLDKAVSVDFMYQLLSSPFMYRQFSFAASGTTVKNLNSDIARNSKVPIPSLKEQAAITEKLDEVQVKTQANKQVFQQKLEQLQQLKASLLDSAFRGEL